MHTHLVAGAFFSLAICLTLGALLCVAVRATGRRNVDYLLFAAASFMLALYSGGLGIAYQHGASGQLSLWALGLRIARCSGLLAIYFSLFFSIRFVQMRHERVVAYANGLVVALLALLMMRAPYNFSTARVHHFQVLGLEVAQAWAPVATLPAVVLLIGPGVQAGACVLLGRAYLRGRRETLSLFVGSCVFALTVLNDVLVGIGLLRGLHLMPIGFMVFAFSVSLFFAMRYAATRNELTRRAKELRERTSELSQSRTMLRAIQTELGRKEQLAVIGEMAAVIAHEVRNPLAVISNAVASLRREGLCRQDHDVLLGILDEEAVRLNRLVADLLAYARPINVQRQRVVLNDLVQRAALLVGNRGSTRFEFDESSSKGQIWADGNLLRQVFDNIIENGVQAMGGGGTVTIGVKPASHEGVEGFSVSVTDEGEGMDTMVRSRAKDPFFTTRPAGTGLGLAIVHRIVEAHGGAVTIESRSGEGTTVTVFLPLGSESMVPPETRTSSSPGSDPSSASDPRAELEG